MKELAERQSKFIDFIMSKSSEEQVIHKSWSTCAVGQFMKEVENTTLSDKEVDREETNSKVEELFGITEIFEDSENSLYYCLNQYYFETYGELQDYINYQGNSCISDYSI